MLFWGIFGALVLRAVFIFAGVALIETFEWVLYVFGAFLLDHGGARSPATTSTEVAPRQQPRAARSCAGWSVDRRVRRPEAVHRRNGKRLATPLFAVLVLIETTDVVFAVDSIPAILAVTREPFIVFASNAFAILGLRSLYFLLGRHGGPVPLPQRRARRHPRPSSA